jgi:hypothetical protein
LAARVTTAQIKVYERQRYELQQTRAQAARTAGTTQEWARLHDKAILAGEKQRLPVAKPHKRDVHTGPVLSDRGTNTSQAARLAEPINKDALSREARRALDDFEYFRLRYFGRRCMPWAVDAIARLDALRDEPERSFVVINCPPGVGKTTLLHDFCVWETVKTRWMRGLWGSATNQLATLSTKRIRNTLGSSFKVKAKEKDRLSGYGKDAEATLVEDYGRFRPVNGGVWQAGMFVVEQFTEENMDEKEPTWGAFGEGSEEIGWRANLIVWDDLVTQNTINATLEAIDRHRAWFDDVAEERLEPGGLFMLMGQRLAANDTYRYCLDKMITDEVSFEDEDTIDMTGLTPMYQHIVYPAHDTENCKGHGTKLNPLKSEPWKPDGTGGCLIDPYRISWQKCLSVQRDPTKWETVYQQGDASAQDVLVQKLWIEGGHDSRTGEFFPGCWDNDRGICSGPADLPTDDEGKPIEGLVSYILVDPSPSRWWGILWMAYDPVSKRRYVLDVFRDKMQAGDFLDVIKGNPIGLAHEWVMRARKVGAPVKAMVVETNSAERFLLQYDHVRQWMSRYGVRIISHATHQRRLAPRTRASPRQTALRGEATGAGDDHLPAWRERRLGDGVLVRRVQLDQHLRADER